MAEVTAAPQDVDGYVAVPTAMLRPDTLDDVSLYLREGDGGNLRLYRGHNYPITAADLSKLAESGITRLFISTGEHEVFQQYVRENLDDVLEDEGTGVVQRFEVLNDVVRDVMNEAFERDDLDNTLEKTEWLGQRTVELMCRTDVVATDLIGVLYHDYHTFTHSANVSYYCTLLARELGGFSQLQLKQMAVGGLLHDLGKLDIPEALLTKPDRLDDAEFEAIKLHPTRGFRRLCHRSELTFAQLMMVYQHHEKMSGGGYPVGVSGNEIHGWARICSVADIYEALTSARPYRQRLRSSVALEIMERTTSSVLDQEIFACWKSIISTH